MIHQPGDSPDGIELAKAIAIHEQQTIDWNFATLGRGTMDHSLFDDCNCNDLPDADDITGGTSLDINTNGIPDECEAASAPTTSHGSLLVMTIVLLAGTVVMIRRRPAAN